MDLLGVGLAVLAAVALAAQSLAVRVGTDSYRVTDALLVVFAVNLALLLPAAALAWTPGQAIHGASIAAFVAAGILGSLLGRVCYFVGIERLGASRTEPLKALFPVVAVIGAVAVLGESLTLPLAGGVGLLVGGGVVVASEVPRSPVTADAERLRVDLAFPLLAALLYGVDPVFTQIGLSSGVSATVGVAIRTAAAAVGFAGYLLWRAIRNGHRPALVGDRWLLFAGLANTVYLFAYYASLARLPVATVAPVIGSSTLFVVLGAAAFFQDSERVSWRLVVGAGIVVLGIAIVVQG